MVDAARSDSARGPGQTGGELTVGEADVPGSGVQVDDAGPCVVDVYDERLVMPDRAAVVVLLRWRRGGSRRLARGPRQDTHGQAGRAEPGPPQYPPPGRIRRLRPDGR